jgi:hypothetical protein
VACFGSFGPSSLLCFFSSFTFLGRLFSLCICLSTSVFIFFFVRPPVLFLLFCSLVSSVRPLVFSVFFCFPPFSSVLVLYCGSPLESSGSGAVVAEDGDLAYSECWIEERKLTVVAVVCGC